MTGCFESYSRYYDLLYQDKDYLSEALYVDQLARRYGSGGKLMLELGCGTGSHAVHFADLGYRIRAIDRSEEMIEQARSRHGVSGIAFDVADIASFESEERYDVVASLFHVASYQITNEQLSQYLAAASRHLAPEGVFIFDFWYGPAVLTERPSVRVKRAENEELRVLRAAEPELDSLRNVVCVRYEVLIEEKHAGSWHRVEEEHRMRYFSIPELAYFVENVGMAALHWEEWMSGASPSEHTWGVCAVCTAR
jgi:SAM-dependent methyltransferase